MHLIKKCEDFSKEEVHKLFKEDKKVTTSKNKIFQKFDKLLNQPEGHKE
jgi:hypothetical protein